MNQLDALEDLRAELISRIETLDRPSVPQSIAVRVERETLAQVLELVVAAKASVVIAEATEALNEAGDKYGF